MPSTPTLAQTLEIAVGRLAARSDVLVTRFVHVGRQPFGTLEKELPSELAGFYEGIGAFHLQWRFTDDDRVRGSFCLRAPAGGGWIGVEGAEPRPLVSPEGHAAFRTIGGGDPIRLMDAGGSPWPQGTRFAILEGVEEGATVLRVDRDGRASYARYDSDWNSRDLGVTLAPWIEEAIARGFHVESASIDRLATAVEPRPFVKLEVLDVREVAWSEVRAIALSALAPTTLGKELGLGNLAKVPAAEAGRLLAEATADPKSLDPKVLKPFSGIKKTKAAMAQKFLSSETARYSTLRLRLTVERGPYPKLDYEPLRYPPTEADGAFVHAQTFLPTGLSALRLLPDLQGVTLEGVSEVEPDVLRFCARLPRTVAGWAHECVESNEDATIVTTLAVPTSVVRDVRGGQTTISGSRPLFGGPSFKAK
jgi:hypothetical protein